MFLTGHAAVAAALVAAAHVENPELAFGLGWVSHYAMDLLPHGDEGLGVWSKRGSEVARLLAVFLADFAICVMIILALIFRRGFSWPIVAAVIGSMVPDIMWGLEKLFKRKLFWFFGKFHEANHNFFKIKIPFWLGLGLQLALSFILFIFVFVF
jgi:hypothetical protein